MQKKSKKYFVLTGALFIVFLLFTIMVTTIDVQPIGPQHSYVGIATLNQFLFECFGGNEIWYIFTDYLGIAALIAALGFAVLGLVQFIKRKSLKNVDIEILLLGACYFLILIAYLFFEQVVINYRPILQSQNLEASYPSTHVLLIVTITATAHPALHRLLPPTPAFQLIPRLASPLLITITIIGRCLSGVHWFTDILAATLLAATITTLYYATLAALKNSHRFPETLQPPVNLHK